MYQSDYQALVAFIGVANQATGTLLIALLFTFIARGRGRHEYVRFWQYAWLAYAAALLVLLPYIALETPALTGHAGASRWWAQPAYALYNLGKVCFLMFLLAGLLDFTGRLPARRFLARAWPVAVAFTVVSVATSDDFLASAAWQSLMVVAAMAWGYALLRRLPPSARSYGTAFVGSTLLVNGAVWLMYFGSLVYGTTVPLTEQNPLISGIVLNSGYLDILIEMTLAYGLTMVLLEENRRDMLAAQKELADTNQRLQRDALFDPLTGCYNRRAFEQRTGLDAAGRSFGAVAVIDLDELKQVNDAFGHATGDRLIRSLAEVLRSHLREADRVYRIGGDEFVVVLPRTVQADAEARLAATIAAPPPFETGAGAVVGLRASVGAAEFTHGEQIAAALSVADARMYERKPRRRGGDGPPGPA